MWADLPGEQDGFVIVGSHVDSVPAGGWLDGALGIFAALEVLRAHAEEERPVGLRFVDWADEEGARFGRSLGEAAPEARALLVGPVDEAQPHGRSSSACARSTSSAAKIPERAVERAAGRHGVDVRGNDTNPPLGGEVGPHVPPPRRSRSRRAAPRA